VRTSTIFALLAGLAGPAAAQVPDTVRSDSAHGGQRPVVLAPVTVTATRSPLDPMQSPLPAALVGGDALHRDGRTALAQVASAVPGVRAATTGQEIAKPVIRGLGGARVLMLDGGFRLEDYSWSDEDGPSVEPRLASRIEVIRGPASLLYGSDAIGGVVNVIPEGVPIAAAGARLTRWDAEVFGSTNNPGGGAGLEGEWAKGAWGARAHLVGHFVGNTQTPQCELDNTGFTALNGEAAVGTRWDDGAATLRVAHFGGEFKLLEAGGLGAAIPAGCPGGPPKVGEEEESGPERKVDDTRIQLTGERRWHGITLEARGQYQDHTTIEVSDDITPGTEVETIHLGLRTLTVDLLAHHSLGPIEGTAGFSAVTQRNTTTGLAPLVPDASTDGVAVFVVERLTEGPFGLLAGVRGDARTLLADGNTTLALGSQTRDATALTWDAGFTFQIVRGVSVAANVGRAFRAPSLFELFSNGPRLGEARYEIGDPTLKPEASLNVDASLRWQLPRLRGEVAAFRNRISDFVFISPTGQYFHASATDSLRIYRYGQAQATLWGGEVSVAADVTGRVTAWARGDYVHGQNDAASQPLPLMPPMRAVVGAEWHTVPAAAHRWYAGVEVQGVAKQTRLGAFDVPTNGYLLLGLTGGTSVRAIGRALRIDVALRNALDTQYRDFLNRYKEFALDPGRALEVRVGTEF
jgi:outer membrane receptor protein involved in Fe transport